MHTQEEIREDMDRLHAFIDSLKVKYGPEFACAVAAGTGINTEITSEDDPDAFAGCAYMVGNEAMFHQACHCLLKSYKFISGIIDAMECVMMQEHREEGKPQVLDLMMVNVLESLKRLLIKSTDEFKRDEEQIDNSVDQLLRDTGFKN